MDVLLLCDEVVKKGESYKKYIPLRDGTCDEVIDMGNPARSKWSVGFNSCLVLVPQRVEE